MQDLAVLQQSALKAIQDASDLQVLEAIRVEYLGKKGKLTDLLKNLAYLAPDEKPKVGQWVNQLKKEIVEAIEYRFQEMKSIELQKKLTQEAIDVTLPGRLVSIGTIHPVTQIKFWVMDYFQKLGFDIVTGPEVETEYFNFEALNIPKHHPARAMHDTFYFGEGRLLRTHTSPVQIRILKERAPPLRLIAPGRVYRCDSDMTHTPMFHQVEGLLIDHASSGVTLGHLKGVLEDFFMALFGKKISVRFRPSYFPFTEPSAEVDIACVQCNGEGCRVCKETGWLEVLGCGMVHPNVLNAVNICPELYQGWAFGLGLDRLAMLYFGIDDLRLLFENDVMFLKEFYAS
jgi:phenylalanyl-tRNA synthetase alpha chain